VGDGHERAVEQHYRFAAAVDFVVHFDSVDWRVARRWLLLRRHDRRHEHRQEESCCPHVWCNSFPLKDFLQTHPLRESLIQNSALRFFFWHQVLARARLRRMEYLRAEGSREFSP